VPPETINVNGLTEGSSDCDAVLFTHYHGDHIGMVARILPDIPLYMGSAAKELYLILQNRLPNGNPEVVEAIRPFAANKMFRIKDIEITPFSVDHSAYDAYMFLIKAGGKKILHTGDFRSHGFRGKALIPMLKKYVGQIDVLITEGTMLSRDEKTISEHTLQNKAGRLLKDYKYVFVMCSSTNIDRIGAFCKATPSGKYFLTDKYQYDIISKTREIAGRFTPLYQFRKAMPYKAYLRDKHEEKGFCMLVRSGKFFQNIMKYYKENHIDETLIIYSMWKGYLEYSNNQYEKMLDGFENIEYLHTSGHATKQTITEVCITVKPRQAIIPIHSENPTALDELGLLFNIKYLADVEEFKI